MLHSLTRSDDIIKVHPQDIPTLPDLGGICDRRSFIFHLDICWFPCTTSLCKWLDLCAEAEMNNSDEALGVELKWVFQMRIDPLYNDSGFREQQELQMTTLRVFGQSREVLKKCCWMSVWKNVIFLSPFFHLGQFILRGRHSCFTLLLSFTDNKVLCSL